MSAPRVGIVGARRVRQGLGPFVARDLVAARVEVPCFLVTSQRSIAPALAEIERHAGISPRAYSDVERMLDAEALDALAILSPAETHEEYLWRAVRHGLPVLCEKPLVWGMRDPADSASELVGAFVARELLLYENCQWPFALTGFEQLHPGVLERPPRRLRMELQPVSRGRQALGDSLSHPLSLLQTLLPGDEPSIEALAFEPDRPLRDTEPLTVRFRYRSDGLACEAELALTHAETLPRRAALAIDGREGVRVVAPETYRLSWVAPDHRSVPMDDPLTSLVADFTGRLRVPDAADRHSRARDIEQRMALLTEIASAYPHQEEP